MKNNSIKDDIQHPESCQQAGFSFVHVSTLLVVIGLTIGGYAIGKNVLRSSNITKIIAELDEYRAASINFQMKYDYLPGDIPVPAITWKECDHSQCIGNGNNHIDFPHESLSAWQQLQETELLSTSLTQGSSLDIGITLPQSSIENAGYLLMDNAFDTSEDKRSINALYFGAPNKNATLFSQPTITVSEAWSIDEKIDDKSPIKGNIRAFNEGFQSSGDCYEAGKFLNISKENDCGIYYIINVVP